MNEMRYMYIFTYLNKRIKRYFCWLRHQIIVNFKVRISFNIES